MSPIDMKTRIRFPLLFGGIIAAFITGFSYRKYYFHDEYTALRKQQQEEDEKIGTAMEKAMEKANEKRAAKLAAAKQS